MANRMAIVLALALLLLTVSGSAYAESAQCRDGVLAVTGDRIDEVFAKCGNPTWARFYPGTKGRYGRLPVEIWTYDLGEGTFLRVLRFVDGVLEQIDVVSREP
jgi:hypothetical protein